MITLWCSMIIFNLILMEKYFLSNIKILVEGPPICLMASQALHIEKCCVYIDLESTSLWSYCQQNAVKSSSERASDRMWRLSGIQSYREEVIFPIESWVWLQSLWKTIIIISVMLEHLLWQQVVIIFSILSCKPWCTVDYPLYISVFDFRVFLFLTKWLRLWDHEYIMLL